ncbi:phage tail protein, partial [Aeromonas piscicola]
QGQTYGKILDAFTSAFGGSIFLQNGMITANPDTISPVMFNVNEEDIVDSITVSNNAAEYYNTIKVDFQNSESRYCKDTFVLPADAKEDPTIQADGRIFEDTIDCPMSTNSEYIRMFANRELKRAKLCRKSINLSLTNTQFDLKMGRVFTVTHALYKLDTKTKWRITKLESSLD